MTDEIGKIILEAGAIAAAATQIHPVADRDMEKLTDWIARGHNAGMSYMANHISLRNNPATLLENAKSIICIAFNYRPRQRRDNSLAGIADYAYGMDYHDALRKRLDGAVNALKERFGGEYRICIDSAPLFERYWAEESGLGKRLGNGLIAVPGYGSEIFLAEIITTLELPRFAINSRDDKDISQYMADNCRNCGKCRKACPASALQSDGTVDARRCLSYLTIEHRGEWDDEGKLAMGTVAGKRTLFGCDICQRVCPLNNIPGLPATQIEEFQPTEKLLSLDIQDVKDMTQTEFSTIFKGSPIKRAKLAGLQRNASNISFHEK